MPSGDFLARIKLALEGKEKVVSGLSETQRAAQQLAKTKVTTTFDKEGLATGKQIEETFKNITPAASKASGMMNDFTKALSRVIIVAPIWMAFRAVIQSTFALLSEGFKTWEDFDRQLIKSKAVIHDYSGTTDQAMVVLEDRIRTFSKESGIALDQLTSSFYRFGTVGIAFEDALSGAIASAKLAKATLGDVDTISRSLAMTYRLLGDTIDNSLSPMQKQESLAGKIFHLWKSNAFEANEFAASLNNFVSTANIANFTADQTVATLAALGTAGVQGSRGGALLKTSIFKLIENMDKLAGSLGLAVNPELETTFGLFTRVLDKINLLSQTKGIPAEAMKDIQEIFGGVRGAQAISALNALLPELKQNLIDLGKDPQQFIAGLNERFEEVKSTVSGQLDIFRNLRTQIGESFVKALLGADDFKIALEGINYDMEKMMETAKNIGEALYFFHNPVKVAEQDFINITKEEEKFNKYILDGIRGALSLADTIKLMSLIEVTEETEKLVNKLRKVAVEMVKDSNTAIELEKELQRVADIYNKTYKLRDESADRKLSPEAQRKVELVKTEYEILKKQKAGVEDTVIAYEKMNNFINILVDEYNKLESANGKTVEQINKQSIKTALLKGDFEKINDIFKERKLSEEELNSLIKIYSDINKSTLSDVEKRLGINSSLLRIANEEESAIIRQEMALKSMMYGEDYIKNSMDDRLKLAQALTKEADEQEKKSSRMVELFKIVQKYGAGTAQEVSKYLAGVLEFSQLSARAVQALKKILPGEFEQGTAETYFKGTTFEFPEDLEIKRKAERNRKIIEDVFSMPIPTNIDVETTDFAELIDLTPKLRVLKEVFAQAFSEGINQAQLKIGYMADILKPRENIITQMNMSINIEPMRMNVDLDSEQVIEKVKQKVNEELDNKKSETYKKIQNQIENF